MSSYRLQSSIRDKRHTNVQYVRFYSNFSLHLTKAELEDLYRQRASLKSEKIEFSGQRDEYLHLTLFQS